MSVIKTPILAFKPSKSSKVIEFNMAIAFPLIVINANLNIGTISHRYWDTVPIG